MHLSQGFDDHCLGTIVPHLRPTAFAVGDVIYERGDRCNDMYFVMDGTVLIHAVRCLVSSDLQQEPLLSQLQHHSKAVGPEESSRNMKGRERVAGEHIVSKGDIFGEGGLFPSELGCWRHENAMALSWVSAYALSATSLCEIAKLYPEVPQHV